MTPGYPYAENEGGTCPMSKVFSRSTSGLVAAPRLARRDFGLQLAAGALLAGSSFLGGKRAVAADGNAANKDGLYARLRAASLGVLVDGQLTASGFVIDETGLAIMAAHVIGQKGKRVEVLSSFSEKLAAQVVAVDLGHDLALLRLPTREEGYTFLDVAHEIPKPGAQVFCFGKPPTLQIPILLRGMIAIHSLNFVHLGAGYVPSITMAAHIPIGTSGSPWVDDKGLVFGVQSGVVSTYGISVVVAFAAPVAAARRLLETRKHASTPDTGFLVADLLQQELPHRSLFPAGQEEIFITAVTQGGPAARAGIKQWNLIVEAEAQTVRTINELFALLRAKKPRENFSVGVLEPGIATKRDVTITLGLMESSWL
jgi:S1-C subfamily serine protease